jgi:predicted RNA-binding protein with PUA-like domain
MAQSYWLVKQEPEEYSWSAFLKDKRAAWSGIRNYQARNNLRAMKRGDWIFFYHSGEAKQVVGLAQVQREAYPDPTADEGDWSAVDLVPIKPLKKVIGLAELKADRVLGEMALLRQSRLSVSPVTAEQADRLLRLAETRL